MGPSEGGAVKDALHPDDWAALCEALDVHPDETVIQAARRVVAERDEARAHLHPVAHTDVDDIERGKDSLERLFDEARDVPKRAFGAQDENDGGDW